MVFMRAWQNESPLAETIWPPTLTLFNRGVKGEAAYPSSRGTLS